MDEDYLSSEYDSEDESPSDSGPDEDLGINMEEPELDVRDSRGDEEFIYKVLSADEICNHMCEIIREVNQVIKLPPTTTRILLNHFKWDKEKLLECYFAGDQEKLFSDAHVVSPFRGMQGASSSSSKQTSSKGPKITTIPSSEFCMICYIDCPRDQMTGLECGHRFCKKCWVEYLNTKIMQEGASQSIFCPSHQCDILVDDGTVMNLIEDRKVLRRYQQSITNSFVECNRLLHWCPTPDCGHAVKVPHVEFRPVTCTCGFTFCFLCTNEWHDPINCRLLRLWIKKCNDDSETSNWIVANTKECPTCHVTIEKNGGCNHMICKNQNCKIEFCWVCLGPWESHGSQWYNCSRFDDSAAKSARDSQERSRAALQRYLFYANRYANHMQSLKFEKKLYAQVKTKMEEMQQHNMSWIEVQFLKKAVDVLCQCRRTLMYAYAFAYYLMKNNQVHIFEDNQRDLESATECLSEYLERDMTQENLADVKQKVQDKYRYCETRRKVLLDHCHEGNEKEWWTYAE